MSDQPSQPPKPKPGSLRDRIAAFEKTATAAPAAAAAAPAPRPKPAGFASWKPKAPSPPSSPSASATSSTEHASVGASKVGTMSASDAKESITKGGSLKDRMAALQGKGAFGAPAPPTAPKPAVERPKWKPPPVVQAPADDDDQTGEHATASVAAAVERTLSPPVSLKSSESVEIVPTPEGGGDSAAPSVPVQEGGQEDEQTAVDPEEEERQRRAAIAARMARLGGARVGMAPPIVGKKPPVRRPTQEEAPVPSKEDPKPSEESAQGDSVGSAVSKPAEGQSYPGASEIIGSPPSDAPTQERTEALPNVSPGVIPTRKNSEAASIKSSETTDSQSLRNPTSMPVPSVPRRAGPPRKKPAKAPTLPPPDVTEENPEEIVELPAEPAVGKIPEAPADAAVPQKTASAVAELDSNASLDKTTAKVSEQPALIEEAVKIIEHKDPKVLEEGPESEPIANVEEEVPESASSIYLQSPLAPSTLVEETNGVRSPPPSSLSSAQEVVPEGDIVASPVITDSPPVPVLHSAPHALHVDEVDKARHEDVEENEEDSEEEEARKKRVADRIAKMGGINPLAPRSVAPASPPAEEPRSPPLAAAASVPSASATPVAVPAAAAEPEDKADLSSSLDQSSPPKETDVGSKNEQDSSSDEDEGDCEVHDEQWSPSASASHEQVEKSNTMAEPRPGSGIASSLPAPPPIPSSTRPTVQVQQYVAEDKDEVEVEDEGSDYGDVDSVDEKPVAASPPSRPSNPPRQSDAVAAVPAASQHLSEAPLAPPPPNRPAQPPRRIIPQAPEYVDEDEEADDDEETDEEADERLATSQLFVPPPSGRGPIAIQPRGGQIQDEEEDGDGSDNDSPALPVPHRVSGEGASARPPAPTRDEDSEADSDHDGQALPIPPRRPVVPHIAPPPLGSSQAEEGQQQHSQSNPRPGQITPSLSVSGSEEILDEEEGDPIDPAFHSPSRQTSFVNLRSISQAQEEIDAQSPISPSVDRPSPAHSPVVAPPAAPPSAVPQDDEEAEEDAEQLRRKTIAERMAKLGGIRFGAAPIPTPISRPPPRQPEEEDQKEGESSAVVDEAPAAPLSEEEEERARKERIAAKLATMGGMRIGMMMGAGGLPPPPPRSHVMREENVDRGPASAPAAPPVPPTRAVPPSRPPPPPAAPVQPTQDTDSEYGSVAASEEGVKVEAGESEAEESGYEHVEEAPPPVPSRTARPSINRQSTGPSSPPSRPPVPTALPMRRSSTMQSSNSTRSVAGGDMASSPPHRTPQMPHSEYVMVEEPESQEAPPPPPARPSVRPPPSRSAPQAPQPPPMLQRPDLGDSISSQWELPSIPNSSLDFGGASDLTMSWTDAGAEPTSPVAVAPPPPQQPSSPPAPPPPAKAPVPPANERQLSADDLIALWGRVGVQVCEVATSLFEKSRKTLIGDGSYAGFVREVLAAVPNAAPAPTAAGEPYGYTIYVQNGPVVVKRASDIMPGDVVEIQDAKLKGHKGLQTYHQSVGAAGETLVGVVGEFEAKKSKIRVFQANQHVGQQTVESVSYRLEDLKSGLVKVYRVLDA